VAVSLLNIPLPSLGGLPLLLIHQLLLHLILAFLLFLFNLLFGDHTFLVELVAAPEDQEALQQAELILRITKYLGPGVFFLFLLDSCGFFFLDELLLVLDLVKV